MMDIDLGGFVLGKSTQIQMLVVFAVYSVTLIGLGFYVQIKSKKIAVKEKNKDEFASFLTGEGGLKSIEIVMIAVTGAMAGGTMFGAPGLTYSVGYIYTICVYTAFITAFSSLGSCGKKIAIIGQRLQASTILQLLHHRYQDKKLIYILSIGCVVFSTAFASAQLMMAAKMFTAISGAESYWTGLLIAASITVIYTLSGGIKSLARVAVVQGFLMVIAVLLLFFTQYAELLGEYGSLQNAMEFVAATKAELLQAQTWEPLYAIGTALLTGWITVAMPNVTQTTLTYRSPKVYSRTMVFSTLIFLLCHGIMSGTGVLTFAMNPNLTRPDYASIYLSTTLLPGYLAGIVTAGCFAAIQSTVAGILLIAAASMAKDFYRDCINPTVSVKRVSKTNLVLLVVIAIVAVLIAMFPSSLTQLINNFASAGLSIGFLMPLLFGLYWRKATAQGARWSTVIGLLAYIGSYLLSIYADTFWMTYAGNAHPVIPAILLSLLTMIIVSTFTKKVPLGICEVWFCSDYDENFTQKYDMT